MELTATATNSGKRVLVVDDEDLARQLLKTYLERKGNHSVFEAHNTAAALKLLYDNCFDMVISDVNMPGLSGIDLLKEIKRQQLGVPVILITGAAEIDSAVECIKIGAFGYLTKPIDFKRLNECIEEALSQNDGTPTSVPMANPHIIRRPDRIAGYNILSKLGEGNMGTVYLVEKADNPKGDNNKRFALKVLKHGLRDEQSERLLNRFYREIDILSQLSHPNIVSFYDHGDDEHGPFLVMEYVKAQSLKLYSQGLISIGVRDKIHIVRQIADALTASHELDICHRDIKPDNILVVQDLTVKLTDFGIARLPNSELTLPGQFLGTPAYFSPEGFSAISVDSRADIFSLGSVAYELFAGKKPFIGETFLNSATLIQCENPVEPRKLKPGLPLVLQSILAKMMKKDPDERYQGAADLVRDLDACLAAEQLESMPTFGGDEDDDWK